MSQSGEQVLRNQSTPKSQLNDSIQVDSPRILIVEDEVKISNAISEATNEAGFHSEVCSNGNVAFKTALENAFHLIILDINLPGKNGLDILKDLREAGSNIPVLLLTSRDTIDDRMNGFNSGADDYLPKPFYVEELIARVGALIRRTAKKNITESTNITSDAIHVDNVSLSRLRREARVGKNVLPDTS